MALQDLLSNDLGQKHWMEIFTQSIHTNAFQLYPPNNQNVAGLSLIADQFGNGSWIPLTGSGGTGGLFSITGGTGISSVENSGTFTITNIGLVSVTGGTGIKVSGSTGAVVISTSDVSGVTNTDVSIAVTNSGGVASVQATGQFPAVTNQLIFGTTNRTTINSVAPATSHTYLLADPFNNAVFMAFTGTSGATGIMTTNVGPYIKEDATNMNELLGAGSQISPSSGGTGNVLLGINSGNPSMTSSNNTIVGANTSNSLTTGSSNSIYGFNSGSTVLTTGSNNSIFGASSGVGSGTGTQCVVLGSITNAGGATGSVNRIVIGYNLTGLTDNTALIGNSALTDISSGSLVCTLGNQNPFTGIYFSNSGGTAGTELTYYQQSTQGNTATGIWAANQAVTSTFTRIGRTVTMSFIALNSTANTAATITYLGNIPVQYRPGNTLYMPFAVVDNGSNKNGSIQITSGGAVTIANFIQATGITSGPFTGAGGSGYQTQSITYAFGV